VNIFEALQDSISPFMLWR